MGLLAASAAACAAPERRVSPQLQYTEISGPTESGGEIGQTMKFMTLNTAHGRGTSAHQALLRNGRHRENVDRIGEILRDQQPHVVAFQEVDGTCFWSGRFDHVEYLAQTAGYQQYVRGELVSAPGLSHGLALMSRLPMQEPETVSFRRALAATAKGFVVSTITWPDTDVEVDVVSVHLEAFRPALRHRQARELVKYLGQRDRPLIVMGDMNTTWQGKRDVLPTIARELGLKAYQPHSSGHTTLPMFGRRLDWVMVSGEFSFASYRTLPDPVSDHRAVVAEIALTSALPNSELAVQSDNAVEADSEHDLALVGF